MNFRIATWMGLSVLVASPMVLSQPAVGQELSGSIQGEFEDAFFSHDEIFFNNRSIARQVSFLFGLGFPDNEIVNDGERVHEVYETVFMQQTTSGPLIRTPDLANPYQTSLFTSPIIEDQVFADGPLSQPIPAQSRPAVSGPIPALW